MHTVVSQHTEEKYSYTILCDRNTRDPASCNSLKRKVLIWSADRCDCRYVCTFIGLRTLTDTSTDFMSHRANTDRRMPRWRGRMDHRGESNRAVLVSVAQFDPGVRLGRRPGAERDAKRLHSTLSKLGFKVDIHTDLSSEEIYQLFLRESRRPVKDCFLAVLSSHGEEGCVFGADGKPVRLSRIFTYFDNDYMEKKAKVFLIQACRGDALDDGVEVDSAVDASRECGFSQHLSVPVDTAVMYATAPGYGAFMHPLGSVFLQTFCALLQEEGCRSLELTRLMTRLSHRVAYTFQAKGRVLGGKKEMPCLLTRLTRDVFPFAEPGKEDGAAGLSATSLVHPDGTRTRTPSIS